MEKENKFFARRRTTEKEKEENMFLWRRRKAEKEKEENMWKRKNFLGGKEKHAASTPIDVISFFGHGRKVFLMVERRAVGFR